MGTTLDCRGARFPSGLGVGYLVGGVGFLIGFGRPFDEVIGVNGRLRFVVELALILPTFQLLPFLFLFLQLFLPFFKLVGSTFSTQAGLLTPTLTDRSDFKRSPAGVATTSHPAMVFAKVVGGGP